MMRIFAAIAAAIFFALPAQADTACHLARIASYDMIFTKGGHIAINLQIGDQRQLMIVDTGGVMGMLSSDVAKSMNLPATRGSTILNDLYGHAINTVATAPSMTIGPVTVTNVPFAVIPPKEFDNEAVGIIGPDVLRVFDLDLDSANKKVNFFNVDHCPHQVVYWTTGTVGTVPFTLDSTGHIDLSVQLDGKDVDAIIDTGAPLSTITTKAAQQIFGITPTAPAKPASEAKPVAANSGDSDQANDNGKPGPDVSHHFASLAFGNVTVQNPPVAIMDDGSAAATSGLYVSPMRYRPMIVGLWELKNLHVYIAYKEKVVYVSAAAAH